MLSGVNYVCMASSQSKFVLSNSSIAVNLSKYEKILCFLFKNKKVPHGSFYKDEWFLDFSTSILTLPYLSLTLSI